MQNCILAKQNGDFCQTVLKNHVYRITKKCDGDNDEKQLI